MPDNSLRSIPAVEKVLKALGPLELPRPVVLAHVRRELAELRTESTVPDFETILNRIRQRLENARLSRIQPVVNATGIILHTNLGRAPLGRETAEAVRDAACRFNNLEFDLVRGERGKRGAYLEDCLALLCGAEAATVVNNCAAALVLILRKYAAEPRREVIISRSELVQIGGGFRIPDILEASGARLREVGTTNKTDLNDYKKAIGLHTGLILKVHQSNFYQGGFVESPSTEELAALAHEHGIVFVEDLGSGAIVATETFGGVEHEPTPAEVLRRGVDLVCFSGDKLFGGPQAGIIAGRKERVADLKREPFFRALRCDKLILAALQATAEHYLRTESTPAPADRAHPIPIIGLLALPLDELRKRAEMLKDQLQGLAVEVDLGIGQGQVGGGSLPRTTLTSVTLELMPASMPVQTLAARLRRSSPPIIGYIADGRLKLDLRTVFPEEDAIIVRVLREILVPGTPTSHPSPTQC